MKSQKTPFLSLWRTEPASAAVLLSSLFLCAVLTVCNILNFSKKHDDPAHIAVQAEPTQEYEQFSDPLLVLVNGKVPLPEDWQVTPRMIDDELVDLRMYQAYSAMEQAAAKDDVWFWVASGYRSIAEQEQVLEREIQKNHTLGMTEETARIEALRTIAEPGHSEHHTGLAVDLNDVSDDFETTKAYKWLQEHAAEYGFIQRYEESKAEITGIDKESWHYRYVGKAHAQEMLRLNLCLEEYVEYLKNGQTP